MATNIKIVTIKEFIKVTPEGMIDMSTSSQLLIDIAKAKRSPADYDLLVDFRDAHWEMSITDIYQLASELCRHGDTFRGKVAFLVMPGVDFETAYFLETCSHNRGFLVNAFTDFETAICWFLSKKDVPNKKNLPNNSTQVAPNVNAELPKNGGLKLDLESEKKLTTEFTESMEQNNSASKKN